MHYQRWLRYGDPLGSAPPKPPRPTPTHAEVMAEMKAAYDRARKYEA